LHDRVIDIDGITILIVHLFDELLFSCLFVSNFDGQLEFLGADGHQSVLFALCLLQINEGLGGGLAIRLVQPGPGQPQIKIRVRKGYKVGHTTVFLFLFEIPNDVAIVGSEAFVFEGEIVLLSDAVG
jgi:hypothetical protein